MNTEARMMVANAVVKQKEKHLEHHGILGMKWGIRRYQPYGQGGYNPERKGRFIGMKERNEIKKMTPYQKASESVKAGKSGDTSRQEYIDKTVKDNDRERHERLKEVANKVQNQADVEKYKREHVMPILKDVVKENVQKHKEDVDAIKEAQAWLDDYYSKSENSDKTLKAIEEKHGFFSEEARKEFVRRLNETEETRNKLNKHLDNIMKDSEKDLVDEAGEYLSPEEPERDAHDYMSSYMWDEIEKYIKS